MVAAPSFAVMVIGFEIVIVSALEPAVLIKIVPRGLTALVPSANVWKGLA
jgi:hypothetical protein